MVNGPVAKDVLSQTFFGIYEFFANIIPGTIVMVTIIFMTNLTSALPDNTILSESLLLVVFAFIAFIVGLAIQGASALLEKRINKRKYHDSYLSTLYLTESDATFPKYFKDRIRELVNKKFGTPTDAPSGHIFDLCYTYVMQKNVSERVPQFLRAYTFSRNMIVTSLIESTISFWFAYQQQQVLFFMVGISFLVLTFLFYKRFLRYSESFAKEVLRSFFVDSATTTRVSTDISK